MLTIYIRRRASTYKCYGQKSWSQLPQTLFCPQQDIFKTSIILFNFFSGSGSFHRVSYQTNNRYFLRVFNEELLDFNQFNECHYTQNNH